MVELLEAQWFSSRNEQVTKIKYVDHAKRTKFIKPKFDPYFFIKREDKAVLKEFETEYQDYYDNGDFISFSGEPAVKVTCMYPSDVGNFRNKLEEKGVITFESDVPFVRRWMLDEGHRQCELDDRLYVDIEVDSRSGFPSPKQAKYQILSIATVDNKGNEEFFCDTEEQTMLSEFFWLISRKYHVMTGWNFEDFDLKYLSTRCKVLGLQRIFAPIQYIDSMFAYQKNTTLETKGYSAALDSVALRLLGIGKAGGGRLSGSQMWASFTEDPTHSALRTYNMGDSLLVKYLDESYNLIDPFVSSVSQYPLMLKDLSKMSLLWEALMLEDCKLQNPRLVMPRRKSAKSEKGSLTGGLVFEPQPGVYDAIAVFDFTSLYNSIMQALSISPELVVPFEKYLVDNHNFDPETVHHTKVDKKFVRLYTGFVRSSKQMPMFTRLLRRTEALREDAKGKRDAAKKLKDKSEEKYWDIKQLFYKTVLVSSYGVQGFKSGRFYNPNLINMITETGQWLLEVTKEIFESIGWEVLYGDTDSVMVRRAASNDAFELCMEIWEIADLVTAKLRDWISKELGAIEPHRIELKAEKIYNPVLFSEAKKRRIGILIWKEGVFVNEKEYVGFESKRVDSFDLIKEAQDNVSNLLFEHRNDAMSYIDDYMSGLYNDLVSGNSDDKLVIERRMNKDFDEYKNPNIPMLRVAKILMEGGLYKSEEPIRYVTTTLKPKRVDEPVIDGIIPPIDITARRHYWGMVKGMVGRITDYLGEKQCTLEEFSS